MQAEQVPDSRLAMAARGWTASTGQVTCSKLLDGGRFPRGGVEHNTTGNIEGWWWPVASRGGARSHHQSRGKAVRNGMAMQRWCVCAGVCGWMRVCRISCCAAGNKPAIVCPKHQVAWVVSREER